MNGLKGVFVPVAIVLLFVCAAVMPAEEPQAPGEDNAPPVNFMWGVPEGIEMGPFAGLGRAPEAEKKRLRDSRLEIVWEKDNSYVLPLFAFSEHSLTGVRYFGESIPDSLEVEWLDPRRREWHPLKEIPSEMIKLETERENDHVSISFGPPEGAVFREGKVRFIWFRVTPHEAGEFESVLFAFQPQETDEAEKRREAVSNKLILEAEVISPGE